MNLEAILMLAHRFAEDTATKDGFEITVPRVVFERILLNTSELRRLGAAQAGDTGALFLQSPVGVITIRTIGAPLYLIDASNVAGMLFMPQTQFNRDPANCPHQSPSTYEPHGVLKAAVCRDCGADLMATMRQG